MTIYLAPSLKIKDLLEIYEIFETLEKMKVVTYNPFHSLIFAKTIFNNNLEAENEELKKKYYDMSENNIHIKYDIFFEDLRNKKYNEDKSDDTFYLLKVKDKLVLSNKNNKLNLNKKAYIKLVNMFKKLEEEKKKQKMEVLRKIRETGNKVFGEYQKEITKQSKRIDKLLTKKEKCLLVYYFLLELIKAEKEEVSYRMLLNTLFDSNPILEYVSMQLAGLLDLHNKIKVKVKNIKENDKMKKEGKKIFFMLLSKDFKIEEVVAYIIKNINNRKCKENFFIKELYKAGSLL